jgi:FG-GAP repeat
MGKKDNMKEKNQITLAIFSMILWLAGCVGSTAISQPIEVHPNISPEDTGITPSFPKTPNDQILPKLPAWDKGTNIHAGLSLAENSLMGSSVAADGDTIAVGIMRHYAPGSVEVFRRENGELKHEASLIAHNSGTETGFWSYGTYEGFGGTVAISENTIVVGAHGEDSCRRGTFNETFPTDDNNCSSSGAAYVFSKKNGVWIQTAYLKASNNPAHADAHGGQNYPQFGNKVSISGDTILVSAPYDSRLIKGGQVYVFRRNDCGEWHEEAILKALNADPHDYFGRAIGVSGDTAIIGAPAERANVTGVFMGQPGSSDNSRVNFGAAYIFERKGTTWSQTAYLKAEYTPPGLTPGGAFGDTVAISGKTIAVSADGLAVNNVEYAGVVFVYDKDSGGTWRTNARLIAPTPRFLSQFGRSGLSIYENTIAVGAPSGANNLPYIGAHIFKREGIQWKHEAFLQTPTGPEIHSDGGYGSVHFDGFGTNLAISKGLLVAGASHWNSRENANNILHRGAAFIFHRTCGTQHCSE